MFSCEFFKIFKSTFLKEHLRAYLGPYQTYVMELSAVNYSTQKSFIIDVWRILNIHTSDTYLTFLFFLYSRQAIKTEHLHYVHVTSWLSKQRSQKVEFCYLFFPGVGT